MVVYEKGLSLYLNLTNRCPTACVFCIKKDWDWWFGAADLKLRGEPTVEEALSALELRLAQTWTEVVYCGYGECVYRLPEMGEIACRLKSRHPGLRLRLNTVGLGSLIWGRDIVPELALYLDEVAVSLNTADPQRWLALHRPRTPYRERGFQAARDFAAGCAAAGIKTTVTAVGLPGEDLAALRAFAAGIGAGFRERPQLA